MTTAITAQPQRIVHVRHGTGERTRTQTQAKHLRVAAYCRVSTDDEEQLTSYKTQIAYYTNLIEQNPNWSMVSIFADEGITGTIAQKRPEFMKLIKLCRQGKIDLVLAKSISRFARNSLDSITYARELRLLGIGIYFEKENLNTLEMTNEMLFTILSAFAQAESESLSENVKWGKRNSLKNGNYTFVYSRILGYKKGEDGQPEIVPSEAVIVRRIFSSYLAGYSIAHIKQELESECIPSKNGGKWSTASIRYILQNEKYIGDILLQKTYVVDCISKKTLKNNGEVTQYYIEDNHPAIIPKDLFHCVQEERARRSAKRRVSDAAKTERGKYSGKYALTELLVCGECGAHYRRCTWARGGKKRIVWRCISRLEHGTKYCKRSPTLDESLLHDTLVQAINELEDGREEIQTALAQCLTAATTPQCRQFDRVGTQHKLDGLRQKMLDLTRLCASDPDAMERLDDIFKQNAAQQEELQKALDDDAQRLNQQEQKSERLQEILARLDELDHNLTEYRDETTRKLVEQVKVVDGEMLHIVFKGGIEVDAVLSRYLVQAG